MRKSGDSVGQFSGVMYAVLLHALLLYPISDIVLYELYCTGITSKEYCIIS